MALINAWYIKNPPWKQIERDANNTGRLALDRIPIFVREASAVKFH